MQLTSMDCRSEIPVLKPASGEIAPWFVEAVDALEACNPTTFDGRPHQRSTKDWLDQIERVWRACGVPEEDWVSHTAGLLEGDALRFWQSLGEEVITSLSWDEFGDLLKVCFPAQTSPDEMNPPPTSATSQEDEGTHIREGKTVTSYANRFVRRVLSDKGVKRSWIFEQRRNFWEGLPEAFRRRIFPYLGQMVFQLIDDAKDCEWELLQEGEDEWESTLMDAEA